MAEGPELFEIGTEKPTGPPTTADRLEALMRTYWQDPKVSWEEYPRVADYMVATAPELFR